MSFLYLNLDLGDIKDLLDMKGIVDKSMNDAARDLAKMTETKIHEIARQKLKSRYQMYVDGLKTFQDSEGVWVVSLDSKVRWIDDGQQEHSMLGDLLNSPKAKTSLDGSKYMVVPFNHGPGKGAANMGGGHGAAQGDLISTLKKEMKSRNIPWAKIEHGENGLPKVGKLHGFDISKSPTKTHEGPGQGKGHVGEVRQGKTGTPFLQGVGVYQTPYKGPKGEDKVKRSVMTFRTASSKHIFDTRWTHPGTEPLHMMEDALEWARSEWQTKLEPEIVEKIIASLG